MKTPKNIQKNDVIALSSMSDGITKESKKQKLLHAIKQLESQFIIKKDLHLNCSVNGESCDAKTRAKELMTFIKNKDVKGIISITGGNYLLEILDYLDFELIKKNIKWFQGQSDTTILLYVITTMCDIKTIYSYNANSLSVISDLEYNNNIDILKGKNIVQCDFQYKLDNGIKNDSNWISNQNIDLTGRIIGGCLECLMDLVGTNYDYTKSFIEKYKDDGIIWYFDIDYMANEQLLRNLWHLNKLGWFKYTKCIIFGRLEETSHTGITFNEAINRGLNNTSIPIIMNFDLGHTYPRVTIINGSRVRIICNERDRKMEIVD